MISVENVFVKYPTARADIIKGVTFHVKQGEIFGFLGPSAILLDWQVIIGRDKPFYICCRHSFLFSSD